ncbi:hypothetical protein GCM10027075_25220 [Streptomyces heilongjiangensis]
MQARADRGRGGVPGAVGVALLVRVLADGEHLGVARVVRRVRVRAGAAVVAVAVAEVLRLAVVPLVALVALGAVAARPAAVRLGPALVAAPAAAVRRARGRLGIAVRRAAGLRGLLSVRGVLRSRLRSAVVPAASDPESSHVIERTWSRRAVCRAGGHRTGFAAEL